MLKGIVCFMIVKNSHSHREKKRIQREESNSHSHREKKRIQREELSGITIMSLCYNIYIYIWRRDVYQKYIYMRERERERERDFQTRTVH